MGPKTTSKPKTHDDQADDEIETENPEDDGDENPPGVNAKKKVRKPRAVKTGETVTLRRAGSCRKILMEPAKVKKLDFDQVATLEILEGRSKGHVVEGVKRYNLEDAIAPTDQVLPSWIADAFEV